MKMIWFILIGLGILIAIAITNPQSRIKITELFTEPVEGIVMAAEIDERGREITRTKTTVEVCDGNSCSISLYGGIRYIYEDDEWKDVEDARSLFNQGFKVHYIKDDGVHKLEVVDFNHSSIRFNFNYNSSHPNFTDYEYEIDDNKMKTKFKIKNFFCNGTEECVEQETEYEIEIEENNNETPLFNIKPFGKTFVFGGNSTVLKLNATNSENLEDSQFDEDTVRDGTFERIVIDVMDGTGELGFIKWNINAIPGGRTIENATMCFYVRHSNYASNNDMDIWYVANQSWLEEDIDDLCGGGNVCADVYGMFTSKVRVFTGQDFLEHWECIGDLHSAVQTEYDAGRINVSYAFNNTESGSAANYYSYCTKEPAECEVFEIPYFNITYSDAEVCESTCTPPESGDWCVNETCTLDGVIDNVPADLYVQDVGFLNLTGSTNLTFNMTSQNIYVSSNGEINLYEKSAFNPP